MISVDEALGRIFDLITPLGSELIPLSEAAGRVLATPVAASRDQPPFVSSAMDGYALRAGEAVPGATLKIIGESAAGHRFAGRIESGQAVRIFTGAPVPDGADRVVMQEDVSRSADQITIGKSPGDSDFIRAAGGDFKIGDSLSAPRLLSASDVALLAAMNIAELSVTKRPVVALIATGDELMMPGDAPGPDQIIASNCFGLAAMVAKEGGQPRLLPIARDNNASLKTVFGLAEGADMLVTIGGASVGDHDIVGDVAAELGMKQSFYKVAMRPGKPLMAGKLGHATMLGLPGNPVSSMVCGTVFMLPALRAMLGLGQKCTPRLQARLSQALTANGQREHYMRARLQDGKITAFDKQDSSLLTVLSEANALLVRPVGDPARKPGDMVACIPL